MKLNRHASGAILLLLFILLSCGMFTFVTGCGSGGGSGSSSSTSNGIGDISPSPATGTPVSPSANDQVISAGNDVTVMIPGGMLQSAQPLTVTPVASPPAANLACQTIRSSYEVTLGELHDLGNKEIIIAIPYVLSGSEDPLVSYFGAYYDEDMKNWVTVPTSVSVEKKMLFLHTNHLSKVCYGAVKGKEGGWSYLQNERFILYYDPAEADGNVPPPPAQSGYYPNPNAPPMENVNRYVSDVWYGVNNAYEIFRSPENNFPDIPYGETRVNLGPGDTTTMWIRTQVFVEGLGAAKTDSSGNIIMSYAFSSYSVVNQYCSHELFHKFQQQTFNWATMKSGKWWMEATAEMAAGRLVGKEKIFGTVPIMGGPTGASRKYWLRNSLDFASTNGVTSAPYDEHEYNTSYFLAYLCSYKGIDKPVLTTSLQVK